MYSGRARLTRLVIPVGQLTNLERSINAVSTKLPDRPQL